MVRRQHDDLIFDLGAHKGEDSAFYLKLGYRVVAVEAHPDLARGLRARFDQEIVQGDYVLIEAAISDAEGR